MHLLRRGIEAVSTAMTSTGTRLAQLDAKATATPLEDFDRLLLIADEMKSIAPTSPKGYLLAGRVYLKKDNLEAALSTYKKGLERVPDIISSYSLLERNRKAVEAEIKRREGPPVPVLRKDSTFAYNIISLIFSHLSLADLIKCTTVCEPWFQFIIEWPWFWHLLKIQVPQLDPESFREYLLGQGSTIKYIGVLHEPLIPNALSFVSVLQEHYDPVELLYFENVSLHRIPTALLDDLQSQPLQSIEFSNVQLSSDTLLGDILVGCKKAKRFTYRGSSDSNRKLKPPSEQSLNSSSSINPYNVPLGITHLEISFGEGQFICQDNGKVLIDIIRKCSGLQHLVLDSHDPIPHGDIISAVNEACPRIQNLVINRECQIPKTTLHEDWTCHEEGKTQGLRRLVLAGNDGYNATSDDLVRIVKNHRQTIELLYLHHDGQVVTSEFLYRLAYLGDMLSNLRELWIYSRPIDHGIQPSANFAEALGTLVFHCPSLEALAVVDQTTDPEIPLVTDQVLQSLVLRCTKLRSLRINGCRGFTAKSLLQLASVPHTQVDTLDLSFMHRDLVKVIHQWHTVKNLVLRTKGNKIDHASESRLDSILRERNGKFHRTKN
ncbi:hypothetical protein BJV82DRAFT_630217 [Fennellomyces sp. T-0311]|nr:hypothetical protein BJV82DRAFT_630217 [Fennellomyces sp. T-0311]